jgi:hypothetical protein
MYQHTDFVLSKLYKKSVITAAIYLCTFYHSDRLHPAYFYRGRLPDDG